jgi:hypothetical protein
MLTWLQSGESINLHFHSATAETGPYWIIEPKLERQSKAP